MTPIENQKIHAAVYAKGYRPGHPLIAKVERPPRRAVWFAFGFAAGTASAEVVTDVLRYLPLP